MKGPVHLKIVHRNRIFRECLASILVSAGHPSVTPLESSKPKDVLAADAHWPAIVVLDLNLPDGHALELTRELCARGDGTRVVLLTHANVEEELLECIAAGADGCILEESSLDDLKLAIGRVARGEQYCSPTMVHTMFSRLAQSSRELRQRGAPMGLTAREFEILRLIDEGLLNKQIARRLSLSLFTVKNHVHNILEKLKVSERGEAVELARKHHWLDGKHATASAPNLERPRCGSSVQH